MNKSIKLFVGILVVIGIVVFITVQTSRKPSSTSVKAPVTIAAILPFTGNLARYGELEKNGLELARAEINNNGGINGRELLITYEDGQGLAKPSVDAWSKVKLATDPPLVITAISASCQALSPLANESHRVLLASDCAVAKYSSASDYTFRILSSNAKEGKQMADYLIGKGIKSLAVLKIQNDYGDGLYDAFSKDYADLGGTIVVSDSYGADQRDFRTQLNKIKSASSAQALYLMAYAPDAEVLLKQIKELGITLPLFAGEPIENAQLLQNASNYAEGVIYLRPQINSAAGSQFSEKYHSVYGKDAEITPARMYDALNVAAVVLRQCDQKNNLNADCIKDGLYGVKDYQGTVGPIDFDLNGDVDLPYAVKTIKNGKFELVIE